MLRYRVASLLMPFYLLGPAYGGRLGTFRWTFFWGLAALCASYIVATCLNDLSDLDVDRVNHPAARDRPLVSGEATPAQLKVLALIAGASALGAGFWVGPAGTALVAGSLIVNVAYSVRPLQLSHRSAAAPLVLSVAYVALPFGMGLAAAGAAPNSLDVRVVISFAVLFAGRMLLKDFRDLPGDAAFGKRTFLLDHGKDRTVGLTLLCVLAGNVLLLTVLPRLPVLILATELYFAGVLFQLHRLWRAHGLLEEQRAIGLGARLGNGVILTLLGVLLLEWAGAPAQVQLLFVASLALFFWAVYAHLSRQAQSVPAYRA